MKKIFTLIIASSLVSVAAMAVGPTKEVNCKDVVKKVKEMQDKKAAAAGTSEEDKAKKTGAEKTAE